MKTSNVNSKKQQGFIKAGWISLHQAVLDRGVELDYYPPDYPELIARSYLDKEMYRALIGRVLELANIDIDHYGARSTLISRAIWRWLKVNANCELPQLWRALHESKSLTSLLAAFKDGTNGQRIMGAPHYTASDLPSVARFGYWLFREGTLPGNPQLAAIMWGLAFIGAAWDIQFCCDRCKICFRRSRPGEAHCDFHSQSISIAITRSEAFMRYRYGLRARELASKEPHVADLIFGTHTELYVEKRLALPDVLFPLVPLDGDSYSSHRELIASLKISPRVVTASHVQKFHTIPHSTLVEHLRRGVDPYNWNNDLWEIRVLQAERWLEFEEKARPGVRGQGQKTSTLVNRAVELALSGYAKGQIATNLGVTPSAVSQWLRRYTAFYLACEGVSSCESTINLDTQKTDD